MVQLRRRQVASDRTQLELRRRGRLPSLEPAGTLARERSRLAPQPVPARLLAHPVVVERRKGRGQRRTDGAAARRCARRRDSQRPRSHLRAVRAAERVGGCRSEERCARIHRWNRRRQPHLDRLRRSEQRAPRCDDVWGAEADAPRNQLRLELRRHLGLQHRLGQPKLPQLTGAATDTTTRRRRTPRRRRPRQSCRRPPPRPPKPRRRPRQLRRLPPTRRRANPRQPPPLLRHRGSVSTSLRLDPDSM